MNHLLHKQTRRPSWTALVVALALIAGACYIAANGGAAHGGLRAFGIELGFSATGRDHSSSWMTH